MGIINIDSLSLIFRILFVTIFVAAIFVFRKRFSERNRWLVLVIYFCFAAFAGNEISIRVPHIKEKITLTALGEKNQNSKAAEVQYLGCSVKGEDWNKDKKDDVHPVEQFISGKWFFRGDDSVMWRIETDKRQPQNMTREIVVEIPVARSRNLHFAGGIWRGFVKISGDYFSRTIDTYTANGQEVEKELPSSPRKKRILDALIHLVIFAATTLALFAICFFVARYANLKKERWQTLTYFAIAAASLLLSFSLGSVDSFWCDELLSVDNGTGSLFYSITATSAHPPLFMILIYPWFKIAPYGECWLILPNAIITALGIFALACTGRKFFGYMQGLAASVFAMATPTIVFQCGAEFRDYALMFLASILTIYLFFEYLQNPLERTKKNSALYTLAIIFSALSHYFALLLIVPIFFWDLALFIKGKTKKTFVIPYVVAGLCYLPWLLLLHSCHPNANQTWIPIPKFSAILSLVKFLCGNVNFVFYIFVFGCVVCVYENVKKKTDCYATVLFYIIVFVISFVYLWATKVHFVSEFWVNRYFICLVPSAFLLFAKGFVFGIESIANVLGKKFRHILFLSTAIGVCVPVFFSTANMVYRKEDYRGAANFIYNQSNYVFNSDTLILTTNGKRATNGWNYYYIEKCGKRDSLNVKDRIAKDEILNYKRIYVLYQHSPNLSSQIQKMLNENYKQVDDNKAVKVKTYVKK